MNQYIVTPFEGGVKKLVLDIPEPDSTGFDSVQEYAGALVTYNSRESILCANPGEWEDYEKHGENEFKVKQCPCKEFKIVMRCFVCTQPEPLAYRIKQPAAENGGIVLKTFIYYKSENKLRQKPNDEVGVLCFQTDDSCAFVWNDLQEVIENEFEVRSIPYRYKCQCPCHSNSSVVHLYRCCINGYVSEERCLVYPKTETSSNIVKDAVDTSCASAAESKGYGEKDPVDQIMELYRQLPDCPLKQHLSLWFALPSPSPSIEEAAKQYATSGSYNDWLKSGMDRSHYGSIKRSFIAGATSQQPIIQGLQKEVEELNAISNLTQWHEIYDVARKHANDNNPNHKKDDAFSIELWYIDFNQSVKSSINAIVKSLTKEIQGLNEGIEIKNQYINQLREEIEALKAELAAKEIKRREELNNGLKPF